MMQVMLYLQPIRLTLQRGSYFLIVGELLRQFVDELPDADQLAIHVPLDAQHGGESVRPGGALILEFLYERCRSTKERCDRVS